MVTSSCRPETRRVAELAAAEVKDVEDLCVNESELKTIVALDLCAAFSGSASEEKPVLQTF